jgi:hypothetical protein
MNELKKLLKFHTQSKVAELLGYKHRSTITHWLKYKKKIPTHKLGLISKELKKCYK